MPRAKKVLSREDILRATRMTLSNRAAARYLNVSFNHYKKYAQLYKNDEGKTLYEAHCNPGGKGLPKFALNGGSRREPSLAMITSGIVPTTHYNAQKLKYRLIEAGMLKPVCSNCGFKEKRMFDGKQPLILIHKDGDNRNWKLENLEFLCYNCAFLQRTDSIVTEDFVQKQEDYVDRNNKNEVKTWELDDYQKQVLQSFGLSRDEVKDYDKYIVRGWKQDTD